MTEDLIKYVVCKDELGNPLIENLSVFDENLYICTKKEGTKEYKPITNNGIWPSHMRYIRNIEALSNNLDSNEELIYILKEGEENKVSLENIVVIEKDMLHPKKEESTRKIGDKLYLVNYDDLSLSGIGKDINYFIPVQVKMNPDETCSIEGINYTSDSKKELNENIALQYGGYSGLYYLTNKVEVLGKYGIEYYEATKTNEDSWELIKLANTRGTK